MAGQDSRIDRRAAWTPPVRPDWVATANREGGHLDLKAVVPLDPDSMIATAIRNTGLSDFGADDWREPFELICRALDEEAGLNLLGRIMTRSDMLMTLEARLRVEDAYKRHPEIDDEVIEAPILIVGQGRTGTSALLNLLGADPANVVTRTWQAFFPTADPSPEEEARLRAIVDHRVHMWRHVTPELDAVHEFTADIPTESVHPQMLTFQAPAWQIIYGQTPSHYAYMATRSRAPAAAYEKRVLKLLQWRQPRRRWVLKSPDALNYLPDVLEVFPDVGLVWTHRDPIKALSSAVSVVGTLGWARSDRVMSSGTAEAVANPEACAAMLSRPVDWIELGLVPRERILSVSYDDFVDDPLKVVHAIYAYFGLPLVDASRRALADYVAANPREARPAHSYNLGGAANLTAERAAFKRYQDYFGVPSEL